MVLAAVPAAFMIAWAVLLLLWATEYLWIKPMAALLSQLPLVGGYVAGAIVAGFGGLMAWVAGILDSTIIPAVETVAAPIGAVVATFGQLVANAETLAAQLPTALAHLWDSVASAGSEASTALGRIAGLVASVSGIASGLAVARALITTIQDHTIPAARDQAVATADARAASRVASEASTRAGQVAAASAAISAEQLARERAVAAVATTVDTAVLPRIGTLQGELAGLTAVVGTLTAAQLISRLSALETTVSDTFRDCVDPQCRVIGPTLGNLAGLADMGMVLALGALVGQAVSDPEGTAKDVAGVAKGLHDTAAGLLSAFTGVKA